MSRSRVGVVRLFAVGAMAFVLTALTFPLASAIAKTSPANSVSYATSVLGIIFLVGVLARLLAPGTASLWAMFAGAFAGGGTYFAVIASSDNENGLPLLFIPVLGGVMGGWAVATIGSLGFGVAAGVVRLTRRR